MSEFYLIGLPRCRSLWFSHLLTYGNSYCYHERLSKRIDMYKPTLPDLDTLGHSNVGSADTCPSRFDNELVQDSPVVVIHRNFDDVTRSIQRNFGYKVAGGHYKKLVLEYELLQQIDAPNIMHVCFNKLDDANIIIDIMDFCGVKTDHNHVGRMMGSKIQVSNRSIKRSGHAFVDKL